MDYPNSYVDEPLAMFAGGDGCDGNCGTGGSACDGDCDG